MKVLQNGRLLVFSKRTDCWCAFSWTKTANVFGVSRATVSKVMTTYTNHGWTSAKRNSGRKPILSERDRHTLKRIVSIIHRHCSKGDSRIFILKTVSTSTVWRELHKCNIYGRAAIAESLITEHSASRWKRGCDDHKTWLSDDWKYIIWSGDSSFTLFPTSFGVYIWTSCKEACNPEFLVPTLKRGDSSLMIWAEISSILLVQYFGWSNYCEWLCGQFR